MVLADFWKLLAGLGLFLYGMYHIENSFKQIDGREFKLFLKKHTKNKLSAIFSGTFITAIMQSSSIVNLIVLSFVGAGILPMQNALAVAIGANVGGTFNSWLVALLGFKSDLGKFALPIIAIAGIGLVLLQKREKLYQIFKFLMGFGLLFLGLNLMRESMDAMLSSFDFTPYLIYNKIVFVLIGFVITTLIQTSSATVVLVLSALYANVITIEIAVVVVLGAELGTTMKLLFSSIGGIADKKRMAIGNFLFNISTSTIGFIFLTPIIKLLQDTFLIKDPIIILVSFQTFINVIGVFLFYFFLDYFGKILNKFFVDTDNKVTYFIQHDKDNLSETSLKMIENEVGLFIYRVICLNMEAFKIKDTAIHKSEFANLKYKKKSYLTSLPYEDKYNFIKQSEGEILSFYSKVTMVKDENKNLIHASQLMTSLTNAMYSAKGMKDIDHNRKEFRNSVNALKYDYYEIFRSKLSLFYTELNEVFLTHNKNECSIKLQHLLNKIKEEYDAINNDSYQKVGNDLLKDIDIASLFNVNREVYVSCKAIVFSLKDYILTTEEAEKFEHNSIHI